MPNIFQIDILHDDQKPLYFTRIIQFVPVFFYLCLYLEIYWTFQKWNLFFIELYELLKTVVCFYCGHKGIDM